MREQFLLVLVVIYGTFAVAVAVWSYRRTHRPSDYLVANRRAGTLIAGFSQAFNILPVWLMLALTASALLWGLSALWLALALWLGGAIQIFYVAPRAHTLAASQHSVTLTQLLSCGAGERMRSGIVRTASVLIALALITMIFVQLQMVVELFAGVFGLGAWSTALVAAILVGIATAGWWGGAFNDAWHSLLLLICLGTLLIVLVRNGWGEFVDATTVLEPQFMRWDAGYKSVVALAFIAGALSLAVMPLGQPTVINRALAWRADRMWNWNAVLPLLWLALVLASLLLIGWFARVLHPDLSEPHLALIEISRRLLHPGAAGVIAFIVIVGILANVSAQISVLSAAVVNDLRGSRPPLANEWSRVAAIILVGALVWLAPFAKMLEFSDLIFCWTALGAALGPLLLVRLAGKRVRAGSSMGAMSAGFLLVCVFHLMPDAPGDFLERVLPFVAALGIALSGGERRHNPDRADRTQETVHDRLPIT